MNKNIILLAISLLFYSVGSLLMFFGGSVNSNVLDYLFGYFLLLFFLSYPILPILIGFYLYKKYHKLDIKGQILAVFTMCAPPILTYTIIKPLFSGYGYKFLLGCNHESSLYGGCNASNSYNDILRNFYTDNIAVLLLAILLLTAWGLFGQLIAKKILFR